MVTTFSIIFQSTLLNTQSLGNLKLLTALCREIVGEKYCQFRFSNFSNIVIGVI